MRITLRNLSVLAALGMGAAGLAACDQGQSGDQNAPASPSMMQDSGQQQQDDMSPGGMSGPDGAQDSMSDPGSSNPQGTNPKEQGSDMGTSY